MATYEAGKIQVQLRDEGGSLGWARVMDKHLQSRQVAVAAPMVAPIDPEGVAYAGWALAFAFMLLFIATRTRSRNLKSVSLHGDIPELFLIPKDVFSTRRPRR